MQLGPCKIEIERNADSTRLSAEGLAAPMVILVGSLFLAAVVYLGYVHIWP